MRNAAVNGFGVFGLWSLLAACSGSTTYLNKQPLDRDGGGAAGHTGGAGGANSETGGVSDLDAAIGTGGIIGAGGTLADGSPSGSGTGGDPFATGGAPTGITTTKKLDVLIMVDNSSSMADKQDVLARTLPDLISHIPAVEDLHVGVITSSLGGHGSTTCEDTDPAKPNPPLNDHAHLLGTLPRAASLNLPQGFIAWKPADGTTTLTTKVQGLVNAAGQTGCGLEAQLESVYRFLVDPFPPQNIALQPCRGNAQCATPVGIDQEILSERRAFLRPDSALAIVLLSDENDCSIRDSDQYYYAASLEVFLPAAAAVCGTKPNDACCYSCGLSPPQGCAPDPFCSSGPSGNTPSLNGTTDSPNLRCFAQKQRFGIDFLYPVQRYINALRSPRLCSTSTDLAPDANCPARPDQSPGLVMNPLFQDLSGSGAVRDPSMVYLLGIVGAPWQDLQATTSSTTELHYMSPKQLASSGAWTQVLGNPTPGGNAPPVYPADPHMQESIDPRGGIPGPITPPTADPINGHDWFIANRDDLEYACIFPLVTTNPCVDTSCDCYQRKPGENNPLCADSSGNYQQTQHYAKAYPGLRELSVIQGLGPSGLAASICARNLTDPSAQDYGYRPAVEALANALIQNVK